ncbi:MAG: cyclic nucleotide-binding domain-containing protein [Anaerolineales bacterium]|jgi:CRP/FNR family cyclic AMP-dependent transcriptional regulator
MPTDPEFLRELSCFRNLSDDQLNSIAEITNAVCYPPDTILFEEGKPGLRLFFLVRGDVEVFHNFGEADQVPVDRVSGEEVVGCSALIEPFTYTATERSMTEVEVLEVDAASLRELMQHDYRLALPIQQHIIRVLMDRVQELRRKAA